MKRKSFHTFKTALFFISVLHSLFIYAEDELPARCPVFIHHITTHFAEQLTNPQKKNRKSLSQFGYDLSSIPVPIFPITSFINPNNFGPQSYGKPSRQEHNGVLYTCKGGFIDFSHLRCAADWTVYLTFKLITDTADFDLEPEAGILKLHFRQMDGLKLKDFVSVAQKIAFERLIWHEVASWHYHLPNYGVSEQQSTFTPEDLYSDFLGTVIGGNIALRILRNLDSFSYSRIATEEIAKMIASLHPLRTKKASALAYDIVDRWQQLKLPEDKRNKDVWWDSWIIFNDERYCFKRSIDIGPQLEPWLVPFSKKLKCVEHSEPELLQVPLRTQAGASLYNYYEFTISPDRDLFYGKVNGKELHTPFGPFTTQHFENALGVVYKEIEERLLPGFDKRNNEDPVPSFRDVKRVLFKW